MTVACCDPLGLLLVNDGTLKATKLGQSLRSPGSQRRREHNQNADSHFHRLSCRKAHGAKRDDVRVTTFHRI